MALETSAEAHEKKRGNSRYDELYNKYAIKI
jgi:hypothetical protein